MPTSEWNAATSSGIEVIGTRRAITAPTPPPMARPNTTSVAGAEAGRRMGGERRHHRDRHADHAEQVAAPARFRARQAAQRQDEEHAGDEVEQCGQIGVHADVTFNSSAVFPAASAPPKTSGIHFFFFWYIASMRCVTRKPPKMLTEAKTQRDEAERARHDRAALACRPASLRPRAARRPRSPRRWRW